MAEQVNAAVVGIEYRGRMRKGRPVAGVSVTGSVVEFVVRRFRAGRRTLTVTTAGREIGRIGRSLDTGRRTWWAESRPDGEGAR